MASLKAFAQEEQERLRRDLLADESLSPADRIPIGLNNILERTEMVDAVIGRLFGEMVGSSEGVSLVALGGYGRRDLSPFSDVDLLILLGENVSDKVKNTLEDFYTALWDVGFNVGHSVRTIAECIEMVASDLFTRTAMIESRFLDGDEGLFNRFSEAIRGHVFERGLESYLEEKLHERDERYRKHGSLPGLHEPNLKESAGGLRDLHYALWIARIFFNCRTAPELADKGIITPEEAKATETARAFHLLVRGTLHYIVRRKTDHLTGDLQEPVAKALGYRDGESGLAVEQFMRDYYNHARMLHHFCLLLFRLAERKIHPLRKGLTGRIARKELDGGFYRVGNELFLDEKKGASIPTDPSLILWAFRMQQKHNLEMSVELERLLFKNRRILSYDEAQRDPALTGIFLKILDNPGAGRILRAMHDNRILGRFLPEFGRLEMFVRRDAYHQYTVEDHTIIAVETVDKLETLPYSAPIFREIPRRGILTFALLLHDLAKIMGRGHVKNGVILGTEILKRFPLADREKELILFLIGEHLTLSHMAFRRDVDDPELVEELARRVGTAERLRYLYLLTICDLSSVSPEVWTDWKGTLLTTLATKALRRLELGQPAEAIAEGLKQERIEIMMKEFAGTLRESDLRDHLALLSDKYVLTFRPNQILNHIQMIDRMKKQGRTVTEVLHNESEGYSTFIVATPDRPGLFATIAGVLASQSINILQVSAFTRADSVALNIYRVDNGNGEAVTEGSFWRRVQQGLEAVFSGGTTVEELLKRSQKPLLGKRAAIQYRVEETKVVVDNATSRRHTILEIQAKDRIGLLHQMAWILSRSGLDIHAALITTEKGHAYDVFYVTDDSGRKLEQGEQLNKLIQRFKEEL